MTWGEQNTREEARDQLDLAMDKGINFIDTAEMYPVPPRPDTQGRTEEYLGSWLAGRGDRDRLFIATKITGPSNFLSYIRDPLDFSPEQLRSALEASLKRLGTDYVDLYQLHWPERRSNYFGIRGYHYDPEEEPWADNIRAVLETLQQFIDEGKIRYIGLSNETPWGVMRFLQEARENGLHRIVSIQNPYSLLNRTYEVGLSEISMREDVGLLAYSPLAFGLLTGKYHRESASPSSRLNQFPKRTPRYQKKRAWELAEKYARIAEKHGLTPAQLALAWVNTRPFVSSNIIGATTLEQLRENIESIELTLSEELVEEVQALHEEAPDPAP